MVQPALSESGNAAVYGEQVTYFTWLLTLASITGVVLNIRKRRECFYIYAVTNLSWCCVDLWYGIYPQAALFAVYFGLALWGIVAWRNA